MLCLGGNSFGTAGDGMVLRSHETPSMSPRKNDALEPVVLFPQRILVCVARLLGGELGIVQFESGVIPLFHWR